ncbi:hypothetical protein BaRGS_00037200 [Batillaria attramentaria]|uniref:Uncharacterized protein n=1 Tax=Batillaria attramentaria TaxID=370345 RepID=A0ABD0J9B9_9CAEN
MSLLESGGGRSSTEKQTGKNRGLAWKNSCAVNECDQSQHSSGVRGSVAKWHGSQQQQADGPLNFVIHKTDSDTVTLYFAELTLVTVKYGHTIFKTRRITFSVSNT